jgi:hypothetical protein
MMCIGPPITSRGGHFRAGQKLHSERAGLSGGALLPYVSVLGLLPVFSLSRLLCFQFTNELSNFLDAAPTGFPKQSRIAVL